MDLPTKPEIIALIEGFCVRHDMAETRFGRDATGEPQLLASLRGTRSPSLNVLGRIAAFIRERDAERGFAVEGQVVHVGDLAASDAVASAGNECEITGAAA